MRIPIVLTKCKVAAGVAVTLMTASTVGDLDWLARWAIAVSILSAALCLRAAIRDATRSIEAYVKRWSLDVFEHGIKQGIDLGREIEAAEKLIASSRKTEYPWLTSGD